MASANQRLSQNSKCFKKNPPTKHGIRQKLKPQLIHDNEGFITGKNYFWKYGKWLILITLCTKTIRIWIKITENNRIRIWIEITEKSTGKARLDSALLSEKETPKQHLAEEIKPKEKIQRSTTYAHPNLQQIDHRWMHS